MSNYFCPTVLVKGNFKDAANAFEVATDYEIKACIKKLEGYGTTLTQAVDFYLMHHQPSGGVISVQRAYDLYLPHLEKLNRGDAYLNAVRGQYVGPFVKAHANLRLIDVTPSHAEKWIYESKKDVSANSKKYHIKYLRAFFNTLSEHPLAYTKKELNPFISIKSPESNRGDDKLTEKERVLPLEDVVCFLDALRKEAAWDILASQVLVLYCGLREKEARRIRWEDINWKRHSVTLDAKHAKRLQRRVCKIPDNALLWLELCEQKMPEWKTRSDNAVRQKLQRVKQSLREKLIENPESFEGCKFEFHQNCCRVSFASYSYEFNGPRKTRDAMGHIGDERLFHSHYKNLVNENDARFYFKLRPAMPEGYQEDKEPEDTADFAETITA